VTLPQSSERLPVALRTDALESILVERNLVDPKVMDTYIRMYEQDVGPLNGAKVVARAWSDQKYRTKLLDDGTGAIAELGYKGPQGEHIVVVENSPAVHNVIVCTLCSCYPWPVLGLPPTWYKDPAYRSRVVREPRAVLREFGLELGDEVEVRVWDSSSEVRYLVLPERPPGTEGMAEEELVPLVTRDSMVGIARASTPDRP
jgi:nitrile hydratase subunit alpha